jgi:ABC-type sugar transport system ATPase subunit
MSAQKAPDAIRVENVAKSFGAVTALVDLSVHLRQGECLGLIGDNGAGKSTLIKILSGYQKPDRGRIFVNGEEASIRSVDHARSLGIDTVYQDLALVPTLSVAHNMFLNRELTVGIPPFRWLNTREMRKRARTYLDDIGIRTLRSVQDEVAMLSGGQRQAIAIARSVHSGARILLLDELEICDRVVLLQHGRITLDKRSSETSAEELTELVAREYRQQRHGEATA